MIETSTTDGVLTLTLNRPDKANALTETMLRTLADHIEGAKTRGLILTGNGSVFSAGADLEAAKAGLAISPVWERLSGAIAAFEGLTIAALNGTAAGGALGMVLACDLRIAVERAKIFYPVMRLGFLPQPSDPSRMRALIGPARTKMILMAGEKVPARKAEAWGLIDEIVEEQELLPRAQALMRDVCDAKPEHGQAIKAMI